MTDVPSGAAPSPVTAFLLTLAAPGHGHRYAGDRRRGGVVTIAVLLLLAAALVLALLPPVNLPVLVLMALPLLALPLLLLLAAADAALSAGRARAAGTAPTMTTPPMLAAGVAIWLIELAGFAVLLLSLSAIGLATVPNDDMAPTLLEGERVVTWKDYYRDRLPERGDVAVVRLPGIEQPRIMRIVGLPGDSLIGILGVLSVNGEAVGRQRDGDFSWRDAGGTHRNAPRYRETLPGGADYGILQSAEGMLRGPLLGANLRIPDGHYFAIGDNRDSTQSSWDFGFLPGLVLSDRPTVILSSPDGSRIGRSVQPD